MSETATADARRVIHSPARRNTTVDPVDEIFTAYSFETGHSSILYSEEIEQAQEQVHKHEKACGKLCKDLSSAHAQQQSDHSEVVLRICTERIRAIGRDRIIMRRDIENLELMGSGDLAEVKEILRTREQRLKQLEEALAAEILLLDKQVKKEKREMLLSFAQDDLEHQATMGEIRQRYASKRSWRKSLTLGYWSSKPLPLEALQDALSQPNEKPSSGEQLDSSNCSFCSKRSGKSFWSRLLGICS
jgi:hypothetical protein